MADDGEDMPFRKARRMSQSHSTVSGSSRGTSPAPMTPTGEEAVAMVQPSTPFASGVQVATRRRSRSRSPRVGLRPAPDAGSDSQDVMSQASLEHIRLELEKLKHTTGADPPSPATRGSKPAPPASWGFGDAAARPDEGAGHVQRLRRCAARAGRARTTARR